MAEAGCNNLSGMGEEIVRLAFQALSPTQWSTWLTAPLFGAATEGDFSLVTLLLEEGASCKSDEIYTGWTLLHAAAVGGNADIMKAVLKQAPGRKKLETKLGRQRQTPLCVAAQMGHVAVVRALIRAGADTEATGLCGSTPLHEACKRGHHEVAVDLIMNGAKVGTRDNDGWTALHCAAHNGKLEVVKVLLRASAELELRSFAKNWSALDLAAVNGHVDVIIELAGDGADINARSDSGLSALSAAVIYTQAATARALVEMGATVDVEGPANFTALHYAAQNDFADGIRILVQGGAEMERLDQGGWTPLHVACWSVSRSAVHALLCLGANEAAADKRGKTPFEVVPQHAADAGKTKHVHRMLARAPAIRAWQRRGWLVMLRARHRATGEEARGSCMASKDTSQSGNIDSAVRGGLRKNLEKEQEGALSEAMSLLVGLKEEDLFKIVILFV